MEEEEKHTKSPLKIILRVKWKRSVCLPVCMNFGDIKIIYKRLRCEFISKLLFLKLLFFHAYFEYIVNNLRLFRSSQTIFISI